MSNRNQTDLWNERLSRWEEELHTYESSQFSDALEHWLDKAFELLPVDMKDLFFAQIDTWLFHLHGFIQQSSFQKQAEERIVTMAQSYNDEVQTLEDIKKLSVSQKIYIAEQQIAKQKLYAVVQGGMTGTAKLSTIAIDIPAFAALNIRTTQLVAMSFGYRPSTPLEMKKSLQIFYGATIPKKYQYERWVSLKEDLEQHSDLYFDLHTELDHPNVWLQQPLLHLVKLLFVALVSKRKVNNIPLLGVLTAAGTNYYWTKEVAVFAKNYYLLRHFYDQGAGTKMF
ncbi:EcsC family protein [Sutcliffiella rhizosphaerae]|uniref:EcsC family protein n=1 Tax=Sutcliffiella rhizosphaerae TaxID=2880967 RepID=A0ABM8YTP9_9BACI|nr:EcsC family protein [Sutcliffiella rhizosphaerae]CAG9623341.1 hypothetical protein BACCIP111883_04142 [Sutcliffiella rhizosphaerae]